MPRVRESQEAVSLFPFLSILTCVIGVLSLVIALGRLDLDSEPTPPPPGMEYVQIVDRIEDADLRKNAIADLIAQASAMQVEIDTMNAELADLIATTQVAEATERGTIILLQRIAELERRLAPIVKHRDALVDEVDALQTATEQMADADNPNVMIFPGGKGGGRGLKPTFVECTAKGLRVLSSGAEVDQDDIESGKAFGLVLDGLKNDQSGQGILILMLRSDGHDSWWEAIKRAHKAKVRYGYLPVPGTGKIDTSMFSDRN